MKLTSVLLSGLLAGAQAASLPVEGANVKRHNLGHKWEKRDALDSKTKIPVRIALKQQNLDKGMDYLMEVSDPASAKYGQHYTAEEVTEMFAPKGESIDAVKQWLINAGIPSKSITTPKSRGWVDFTTTVGKLESLVGTKYHVFSHTSGKGSQIAAEMYTVPEDIADHVDFVIPAMSFTNKAASASGSNGNSPANIKPNPIKVEHIAQPMVNRLKADSDADNTQYCSTYVTPQCVRAFYDIPKGTTSTPGNRLGIFESDDEAPTQADLTQFYGLFANDIPATTGPTVDLINWGSTKPLPGGAGEAALDFDIAVPIVYPQGTVLFQSKDNFNPSNGTVGFFNQFLDGIDGTYCTKSSHGETGDDPVVDGPSPDQQCGAFKPTNVISFSYGWSENEYPAGYLERQCDEFMKLGLQGTTLVFSSGDGGVAGGHGGDCLGDDFAIFNPQIGAACPYVTTVGSTIISSGDRPGDSELATTRFGSGGGFSNIWSTPDYQQDAVSAYFADHDPGFPSYTTTDNKIPSSGSKGLYNRGGRGYPDLAAYGDFGVVVLDGGVERIGGTSMSTPLVAAIFTRINEERLAAGKALIGFVNPALYANTTIFNDVTLGDQDAGGEGSCLGKSFKSTPGWDPVTGLGTPIYPAFSEYFASIST